MIRTGLIASAILITLMLALSLWAMPHVPVDGQFTTHWNIKGEADGFGSRATVLWLMPGFAVGMAVLMAVLPLIDPRRKNLLRSSLPYLIAWIGSLMVLSFAHAMLVLNAVGTFNLADVSHGPGLLRWISVVVGAFMAALGAVMGKMRPNWFMGVRTPWTLSSDLSWDKTHRLTGWLFMLTGLITMAAAFFLIPRWAFVTLTGGITLSIVIAVGYSFLVWKSDPNRETLIPEDAD
jgi:immunity protein, SdpI family